MPDESTEDPIRTISFDPQRARRYRKRAEVMAFRSKDAFHFSKEWGEQDLRPGAWIVVSLDEHGAVSEDVYGCDEKVFADTYEASPSQRPHRYRKKETVLAYQPMHPFQVTTELADGHVETSPARCTSPDGWIVQNPKGEVYPVEQAVFDSTYTEVVQRSDRYRRRGRNEHWSADGSPKRILALDGGGVRGILTLGYLERVEKLLRERYADDPDFRLCHYFDLIAGTSTGALIAAFLAKGMAVSEIRALYEDLGTRVFRRSWFRRGILRSHYKPAELERILKAKLQSNHMGSDALQTGLLVVAKRLDTGSTWAIANNPHSRFWIAKPGDSFISNEDYLLREVLRASSAAPSYFTPVKIELADVQADGASRKKNTPHGEFVDGGMSPHNNPALLAVKVATMSGYGVGWPLDPDKLMVVSVGTGSAQPGVSTSRIAMKHAVNSLLSMMDDCAELVESTLQWLSDSPTAREIDAEAGDLRGDLLAERPLMHYLRYNVRLDSAWLESELGEIRGEKELRRLRRLDIAENMPVLLALGRRAAEKQVHNAHFPAGFDLT